MSEITNDPPPPVRHQRSVMQAARDRVRHFTPAYEVLADFLAGIRAYRFWIGLSLNDLRGRYRRTLLGPWWLVIGNAVSLIGMGVVWSLIFGVPLREFFPYLVGGFVTWGMLASFMTEGCTTFSGGSAATIQKNIDLPKSIHALRLVSRTVLLFFHNVVVFIGAAVVYSTPVTLWTVMVVPGLAIIALNGVWVTVMLGIFGARYRDIEPLAISLMTFLFLVTPIMWKVEMLPGRGYIASFNPLTHLINVVRQPLLGQMPSPTSWMVCMGLLFFGFLLIFLLLRHSRNKLIHWI